MRLFLLLFLLISYTGTIAQTDEINLQKYWKFRNNFVEKYVKIGAEQGESLAAGALKPIYCRDNISTDGTNPNWSQYTDYGEMHWGDGMIRHGHYLVLLATEYALKKKNGDDLTGTLNELYYALYAINRLDRDAEINLDDIYGMPSYYSPSINGFYLREDVPEDFCLYWQDEDMNFGCTNSAFYENNNVAKINDPSSELIVKSTTSYQNGPSMDQMSSLMLGLSVVFKLVNDVFVKPKATDQGFYIISETKNIVQRLVTYAADKNWELIDVNGWPVANGGGDLAFSALPYVLAANRITGNPIASYNNIFIRRSRYYSGKFNDVQHCVTGFGVSGGLDKQSYACDNIEPAIIHPVATSMRNELAFGMPAGIFNNQSNSIYQGWNQGGNAYPINISSSFWTNDLVNFTADALHAMEVGDVSEISGTANLVGIQENNNTIVFNLGITAGFWNSSVVNILANQTGNRQLELTNAVLYDLVPTESKDFYKSYLDGMSIYGPYNIFGRSWDPDTTVTSYAEQKAAANGWGAEYRWSNPDDINGTAGFEGVFSGLDYMIYYNLYHLLYYDDLPVFEESYACNCTEEIQVNVPGGLPGEHIEAFQKLNARLAYIPTCQPNVFAPVFNLVDIDFNIEPKFNDYAELNINTVRFQTDDVIVSSGANVNVNSDFVICGAKTLLIESGSTVETFKGDIYVKNTAVIDVKGDLIIGSETKLKFGSLAKIILRDGSRLIIEDNAQFIIDYGGLLEFYNGAEIITNGNTKFIHRGTVKMMDGGVFRLNHDNSSVSGLYIIEGTPGFLEDINSSSLSQIRLSGKGPNDEFLILKDNSKIWIWDETVPGAIDKIRIYSCKVVLGLNSQIKMRQNFNTWNSTYFSEFENGGIRVTDKNKFTACDFFNVPVYADLMIEETSKLNIISCNFINNEGINDSHEAILNVNGMGIAINNSTFKGVTNYCINSSNLIFPSKISYSSFEYNGVNSNTLFGINDVSSTQLKVTKCTFDNLYTSIAKADGELALRCNTFNNSLIHDVAAFYDCELNMSRDNFAGYNYFNSPNISNIYILSSTIDLRNGNNYFNGTNSNYIYGTLNYPCGINSDCSINASRNQWGNGLQPPIQNQFDILGSDGLYFMVSANLTEAIPSCGANDNNGNGGANSGNLAFAFGIAGFGNVNNIFNLLFNNLPFINISFNSHIKLDRAIKFGRSKMIVNDTLGSDLLAVNIFDEILNNTNIVSTNNRLVKNWLNSSLSDMKISIENAIFESKINQQPNSGDFDFYIDKYVNALNIMTDSLINQENYTESFYLELDKAHLFRMLNMSNRGYEILTKIDYCGIDAPEQKFLNYWKKEYKIDLLIEQIGMTYLDSIYEVDTSEFLPPTIYNPTNYNFGSKIMNPNTVLYSECSSSNSFRINNSLETVEEGIQSKIYPNPSNSRITFQIEKLERTLEEELTFYSSVGKKMNEIILYDNVDRLTVIHQDISAWSKGVYIYIYRNSNGEVSTGNFVVE